MRYTSPRGLYELEFSQNIEFLTRTLRYRLYKQPSLKTRLIRFTI